MALRVLSAAASLACLGAASNTSAWDLSEWLAAQGKQDTSTSERVECWCKELSELVSSRISTASGESDQLARTKETRHYENVRLKLEVEGHQKEAGGHSQSMGEAQSISERSHSSSQQEVQDLKDSLHSVRKAIDAIPEGSGGQVHDTLKSLEERFSDHLEDAHESMEARKKQSDGLQEAKKEMVRLANKGAATKQQRLAEGLATVAQAERQMDVYNKQREADYELRGVVGSLCQQLESQAADRRNKRQAASVFSAQAKADQAQKEAMQAASRLVLLKKTTGQSLRGVAMHSVNRSSMVAVRADRAEKKTQSECKAKLERAEFAKNKMRDMLGTSQKTAGDLMTLVAKSGDVEGELKKMLHTQMANAHLAIGQVSGEELKASVDQLFSLSQAHMASLEAPFDSIRAKGRTSSLADSRLVIELRSGVADAEQAVLEAKKCKTV